MQQIKSLQKRAIVLGGFKDLGFSCRTAFYNVCKSLDCTFNDFDLINFYEGRNFDNVLLSKLESVLEMLKHE